MKIPMYPEVVPILEASEVCIGPLTKGSNCGCIVHWQNKVFQDRLDEQQQGLDTFSLEYDRIDDICAKVGRKVDKALVKTLGVCVTGPTDIGNPDLTPEKVAAGWNRAMRLLGYTVPCNRS